MPRTSLVPGDSLVLDLEMKSGGSTSNVDFYFSIHVGIFTFYLDQKLNFVKDRVPVVSNFKPLDFKVRIFGKGSILLPSVIGELIVPPEAVGSYAWVAEILDSRSGISLSKSQVAFTVSSSVPLPVATTTTPTTSTTTTTIRPITTPSTTSTTSTTTTTVGPTTTTSITSTTTTSIGPTKWPFPTHTYIIGIGLKPKLKPIDIKIQTKQSDKAPFEVKKISENFILYTYSQLARDAEESLRWLEAGYYLASWLTGPAKRPMEVHLVKDKAEYLQGSQWQDSQRQIVNLQGEVQIPEGILHLYYNPLGNVSDGLRIVTFTHETAHAVIATFRPSRLWESWLPNFMNEGMAGLTHSAAVDSTLPGFAAKVYDLYKTNSLLPFSELEKIRQGPDMPTAEREAYVIPGASFVLYLRERFGREIFPTFIRSQDGDWKERFSKVTGYQFSELEREWRDIVRKSSEAMADPKATLVSLSSKGVDTSDLWMTVSGRSPEDMFVKVFVAYSREAALNDIGNPFQKTKATEYLKNWPKELLSYDDQYDLFTQDMHGMKITLTIHKDWYRKELSAKKFLGFLVSKEEVLPHRLIQTWCALKSPYVLTR